MDKINVMRTLVEVLTKLQSRNEDNEFRLAEQGIAFQDAKNNNQYTPTDLKIVKTYRFEGESDPGDMSVIYVIEAKDGTRGYIMDAYGTYSADNDRFAEALKAVPMEQPNAEGTSNSENDERGQSWPGNAAADMHTPPGNEQPQTQAINRSGMQAMNEEGPRPQHPATDQEDKRDNQSSITEGFFS